MSNNFIEDEYDNEEEYYDENAFVDEDIIAFECQRYNENILNLLKNSHNYDNEQLRYSLLDFQQQLINNTSWNQDQVDKFHAKCLENNLILSSVTKTKDVLSSRNNKTEKNNQTIFDSKEWVI